MEDVSRLFEKEPSLFEGARIIYDAEAVSVAREIVKARVGGAPFEDAHAEKMMEVEIGYARPADTVIVVSQTEAKHFLSAGYSRVEVIGHSLVPKRTASGHGKREGFLFVGRLLEPDSPNADSILWFVSKIFPRIQKELGAEVELFVAGLIGPAVAELLERPGITVLGKVDDLFEFYETCRVFVAPTRYSSGIPLKVLEAAAHGLPVVVTNLLAEQLQWTNGEDLLASSTADEFGLNCVRLYKDELLWNKLRDNALARIATECDPDGFRRRLLRLINAPGAE
jgi:glycosyltransferase involved in cell wall biosynthesis